MTGIDMGMATRISDSRTDGMEYLSGKVAFWTMDIEIGGELVRCTCVLYLYMR